MPSRQARFRTVSLALGASLLTVSSGALAQSDLNYAVPDVLLLVDTSGSMGLSSVRDAGHPDHFALPNCAAYPSYTPVDPAATNPQGNPSPPDRWSTLISVLTGTVQGLSCSAQGRSTADFIAEYSLGGNAAGAGVAPYDQGYYLPYNRIVSVANGEACTPAPSWDMASGGIREQMSSNAIRWPATQSGGPIVWRKIGSPLADGATDYECDHEPQDANGLIDQFQGMARFGLMTFDTLPNWYHNGAKSVGTGMHTDSLGAVFESGVGDTWSYFPNWMTDASFNSASTGWPGGCEQQTNAFIEVGARNPAAPPWEGRLIPFGNPLATEEEIIQNNKRVQDALLALRPYGATPIAGMLEDAVYYLLNDRTGQGTARGEPYWGGAGDPAFSNSIGHGCRKRFVVLLTDGGPNLDLRPDCAFTVNGVPGRCPYRTPADLAEVLANNNIPVYVIGLAVTNASGTSSGSCQSLLNPTGGSDPCAGLTTCTEGTCATGRRCVYGYCINPSTEETLATCCTIREIAQRGGTQAPFFAEDFGNLYTAFTRILSEVSTGTRSRTQPVFAQGTSTYSPGSSDAFASARFLSSFRTVPGDLYTGRLERERYKCVQAQNNGPIEPELQSYNENLGDSFAHNIDANLASRWIYTAVGAVDGQQEIHSERSIRPFYNEGTGDRLGAYGISDGNPATKVVAGHPSQFIASVDPRALTRTNSCTQCCFSTPSQRNPSADTCRDRFLNLELGYRAPGNADIQYQRSSAFGAIVHATPELVTAPSGMLRDETYQAFQATLTDRPNVLYASTTDGQLHAFLIDRVQSGLNELWSFMPPAVLPSVGNQFPDRYHASQQFLLDGPVVARDVAGQFTVPGNGRFLGRTRNDALNPTGTTTRWYSVLVGSFGSRGGYYALDVTWPEGQNSQSHGYLQGPRFLWQLTTDENDQPIFGERSGTPSIATLYFTMPGETEPAEHAVAILPGGYGGVRSTTATDTVSFSTPPRSLDSRLTARTMTARYTPSDAGQRALGGARSVTIVRLDTGEVVRTFRHGVPGQVPQAAEAQAPAGLYQASRITNAGFDAPIVGQIVTYPSGPGAVSDRAYVGDAEGRLWRLDLSSSVPSEWSADMFFDAYPASGMNLNYTWQDAQPIETPPIVSTDQLGRVTLAVSTGAQRSITATGEYMLWSLTEQLGESGRPAARVNWLLNSDNARNGQADTTRHLQNGERVTGAMSLFDSTLYFTTYDPASEDPSTCAAGQSYLWAVHYLNAGVNAAQPPQPDQPEVGPMPALDPVVPEDNPTAPLVPSAATELVRYTSLGAGSVAFGVGVTQRPSCHMVEQATSDPFLGFGLHNSISSITPGTFQLVVQTGRAGAGSTETKITTRNLLPPRGTSQIDSWAAIVE